MSTAATLADRLLELSHLNEAGMALYRGDLTHPDRWPLRRRDEVDAFRRELEAIASEADALSDATDLTATDRTLCDAVAYGARSKAARLDTAVELTSLSPSMGNLSLTLTFLPRHALVTADHGDRFLTRISTFPAFVDDWCARIVDAAADGVVPNERIVTDAIALTDRAIERGMGALLAEQAAPTELDDAAAAAWRAQVAQIAPEMDAALTRLRTTIAEHTLPAARSDERPGLAHLDGGDDIYRRLLWSHTSLDTSPEEVHQIGRDMVARLEDEYRRVAGPLLGTDDVDEIYRRLRDDPSLRYASADAIVADATTALDKAWQAAPAWFHRIPQAPCTAHPIEQGALAFYSPPSSDGAKSGQFFFQTGDPSMWGTYQLEATTYHEGVPGHHFQLALSIELDSVHPLLEEYLSTAYCEGWALYTERLADEMGLYGSELDRVGMLAADSMRACRLVIDTGLHALGWSRQQAIDYAHDHSPLSSVLIAGEVDRYVSAPGQACSYMMGRLAIDEARVRAEQAFGDHFDIRDFHDVVLGSGSIPLDTMRRLVDDWIADAAPAG